MPPTIAQDITLSKLPDPILAAIGDRISLAIADNVMPSASLAIFHRDAPILNAAWGWIDPEDHLIPATSSTLFDLGSITRLYTTIALLSQITEEKIYLQSPIASFVPEFSKTGQRQILGSQDPQTGKILPISDSIAGMTVDPTKITCFHLLTHTSGLPAWRDLYKTNPPPAAPSDGATQQLSSWETARGKLYRYPFANLPERGVIDSDIGYMILGDLISQVDETSIQYGIMKRAFGDRLSNTVYNPLKKQYKRETIAPSQHYNEWRERQLWGEVYDNNASSIGGIAGHAGMFSTAFEVGLIGNVWLNHAEKLLKIDPELVGAAVELQSQTGSDRFGFGWMLKTPQPPTIVDRLSSKSYGFQSEIGTSIWIDPTEKIVISLLTNHSYSDADAVAYFALRRDIHNLLIDFVQR